MWMEKERNVGFGSTFGQPLGPSFRPHPMTSVPVMPYGDGGNRRKVRGIILAIGQLKVR
jgi:hypothetical protein